MSGHRWKFQNLGKIPEIKPSSEGNTSITMWWGNENAVSAFPDYVSNGEVWSAYAPVGYGRSGRTIDYRFFSKPESWPKDRVTSNPVGVLGSSQQFPTGRTDGIKIPASPNFNLGSSFTGSMWMKFERIRQVQIV